MSKLTKYVMKHTERTDCHCCNEQVKPLQVDNKVDMFFFEVTASNNPDAEMLKKLIAEHKGEFNDMNPLDGQEHSYIEVGGWIGDQGLAMQFMALGKLLGLWNILQPMILGLKRDDPLARQMAGMGYVSIYPKELKNA